MKRKNEEITFKDILGIFLGKLWLIVIAALVVSAVMFSYSAFFVKDTYTSKTVMHIRKETPSLNIADVDMVESIISTMSYKVYSEDFLYKFIGDINKDNENKYTNLTPNFLRGAIGYKFLGNGMLRLTVTTGDPELSYVISRELETYIPVEFYDYMPNAFNVTIYDHSLKATVPNAKNTIKSAIIGFILGGGISAVAVLIYSALDTVIRDKKKIEDNFDIPIIGIIPLNSSEKKSTLEA